MKQISKAAVIGAGNMGSGIVQKIATEGFSVVMLDISDKSCEQGMNTIRSLLQQAVERGIFDDERVEEILRHISTTTSYDELSDVDIVIEAVFENLDVKKQVFEKLGEACREDCILATNTSSYFVKDLSAVTKHPERVVGLHYFFHPAKNRLVEVVPTESTSEEVRQASWFFNEMIGKTPIHSADAPGFVVNRFFVPWVNESVRLLGEGIANIATIEAAAIDAFRIGMGPFELLNVTGVPISFHAATTLEGELGDFYAPSPRLKEQVDAGEDWSLEGEVDESKFGEIAKRLKGVVYQIVGDLVDEGVGSIEDVDIGALLGLRWSQGPFQMMNRDGLDESLKIIEANAMRYGLKVPECIKAQQGKAFEFEFVKLQKQGSKAAIIFNRPDAMNALNVAVMNQLKEKFEEAEADMEIKTIVIEGSGKAFVAGADVKFFTQNMKKNNIESIFNFTKRGQELFMAIDNSKKYVIVKLDGLSLGGGSELVLCADAVVATEKASMGFPETGIGIYPGLGGTQRLPRRIGKGLAKWMIYSGQVLGAQELKALGLVHELVSPIDLDDTIDRLASETKKYNSVNAEASDIYKPYAAFFDSVALSDILSDDFTPDDSMSKLVKRIRTKAPMALKISEFLIDEGFSVSLKEGIDMEIARIKEIFSSKDAFEGMSALGKRKPEWINT